MNSDGPAHLSAYRLRYRWWYPAVLGLVLLCAGLGRPLWFDEALTIQNFALLDSYRAIYHNWTIPNNQLLHTMLVKFWLDWGWPLGAPLRLLPVLGAVGLLLTFAWRFPRAKAAVWALAASPLLALHGTALRGYVWSAWFAVLALWGLLDYFRTGKFRAWALYAAACLAAVATLPTNLLTLGAVGLFALPHCRDVRRLSAAAITPFAAAVVFYWPISESFFRIAQWGEGWTDRPAACLAVYGAFAVAFPLFALALPAGCRRRGRGRGGRWWWSRSILLLPLPVIFMLGVAPFPRVFFPLFPLWLLLGAAGLNRLAARIPGRCRRRLLLGAVAGISVLWGVFLQWAPVAETVSRMTGNAAGDDFFYPYYLRPDYDPEGVWRAAGTPPPETVYLSFCSDPWSLIFHARMKGMRNDFRFDGPRGPAENPPSGAWIVLRADEDPALLEKRFGGRLAPVVAHGYHRIYRLDAPAQRN